MEPSLQPSFTFPSRHQLQNYAKGIVDLSSATQRLLVKPKYNTDINIETALQNPLTIAKTLDKDVIDVKAVIPIEPNIYVQPGLAEGMTNLAKLTVSDKEIMAVTSANNALKRGNYKAAEKIVARPLTVEEMQNRSITPETRSSENNPGVKYGVKFNDVAFGAQVDKNSQYNFHQREKMLREAEPFFVNSIAEHLGISPYQVSHLKTTMGFSGDSVLGYYNGRPARRQDILKQFQYAWNAMQMGQGQDRMDFRRQMEGEPLHQGERAARAQAQDRQQRAQNGPPPEAAEPNFPDPPVGPDLARMGHRLDRAINGQPNPGVPGMSDEEFWAEEEKENYPPPDPAVGGASNPSGVGIIGMSDVPDPPGGGPPIIHPQMFEQAVINAPLQPPRPMEETDFKIQLLNALNRRNRDERVQDYFPPDHVELVDSEDEKMPHSSERTEAAYHEEEMGMGIGGKKRKRTIKKQHHMPYPKKEFVPDTDGFYPQGGVLSGNLMKSTGFNAVPLSAQIQVANTHQWNETPLQEWIRHPQQTEVIKPVPIPVSQYRGGIPARSKKVKFGNYLIDHHKLISGGVLSVSHPTGKKVKGMPNREISEGLREVIHAIITGQKVNTKKLSPSEKLQLKDLMHKSVAAVNLGGDVNVSPTKQLTLILGEMEAGNDSEQLKSQLRKLLPSLKRGKCITAEQCADISKHYL